MASRDPGILVAAPGPPFDPVTWSGTSSYLLAALKRRQALLGAVDGWSRPLNLLEKAASFSPDMARWRQRYLADSSPISVPIRRAMTHNALRRARRIEPAPDVALQFGGWYDLGPGRGFRPRLHAYYTDGNLALSLRRGDNLLDPCSRSVRRALAEERRLYDRVDVLMTMSEWLGRSFVEDFGQDPAKVVAVGAGANFTAVPERPERDFAQARILFVGREFERKGGPELLEAFARLRSERPDAELWVVSEHSPSVAPPGVRFFGRIRRDTEEGEETISRLYREATAFALPSIYEPFGISFLEAMAWRLPCLGSPRCAIPEMIENGVNGVLAEPDRPDELAAGLARLVADPEGAERMGEAGHRRFLERFSWDAVASRMVEELSRRLPA
jgi:glycosyltransferase involved in cell wall biosynthesis